MDKKKIIILIVGIVVAIILVGMISLGIAIFNSSEADDIVGINTSNSQNEESEFSWPDLTEYNIPKLEKGVIIDLVDESNENGYYLNYFIKLKSIKKSDLEEYAKKLESNWSVSQSENTFIIVSSDRVKKYSIYITFDEKEETAEFTITSI